jgi:hypothetical protein
VHVLVVQVRLAALKAWKKLDKNMKASFAATADGAQHGSTQHGS